MREQAWRTGCHDCGSFAAGVARDRESALSQIEEWKSEHRLRPGCGKSYTWSSVRPVGGDELRREA